VLGCAVPTSAPRPGPGRRPSTPGRRLALVAGALAAGLLALLVVAAASGRVSVAGVALVGVGLVSGAAALRDRRRGDRTSR